MSLSYNSFARYRLGYRRRNIGPLTMMNRFKSRPFGRGSGYGRRAYGFQPSYRALAPPRTGGFFPPRNGPAPELKAIDVTITNTGINTTGSSQLINGIAIGDSINGRIGRKVTMKSLMLRGNIAWDNGGPSNTQTFRVLVVYDKQTNATLATAGDVFSTASGLTMQNLANRERFLVLMDKQYTVGPVSNAATTTYLASPQSFNIKKFIKLSHSVIYGTDAALIADIASGSLLIVTIGTAAAGNGDGNLNLQTRMRYTDN